MLHDTGSGNHFLDMTPKAKEQKKKYRKDFMKLKNLYIKSLLSTE